MKYSHHRQPGVVRHILLTTTLVALITIFFSGIVAAQEKREFPPWDEGVFAEVATRHGEQASMRLRDVYYLILVHLNDPVEEQLEAVNDYMNDLTWIADSELWKKEDYWATPFETLTTFGGDCEDIAIAKYAVLRTMGIADDQLAFAHVLTSTNENHMVLIYKQSADKEAVILDNQHKDVMPASKRPDLTAIYAFTNDNTVFVIKDHGNAKRELLAKKENNKLSKWLTAKERAAKNSKSYEEFNGGKPLAPSWAR